MQILCPSTNWILGDFLNLFQLMTLDRFVKKLKNLQFVVGLDIFVHAMTVLYHHNDDFIIKTSTTIMF